jgi:hypothetical protein
VVVASLSVLGLDFILTAMMFTIFCANRKNRKILMQRSPRMMFGLACLCPDRRCGHFVFGFAVGQPAESELSVNLPSASAKFDNIGGLKPKAAVKSAGVVVGRVESLVFDDKSFQARVTLALESRYAFPKGQFVERF